MAGGKSTMVGQRNLMETWIFFLVNETNNKENTF